MSAPTVPPAATPADDDPRVAEQVHQLEDPAVDTAFARLAIDHPEHCHTGADYPEWTPGGAK